MSDLNRCGGGLGAAAPRDDITKLRVAAALAVRLTLQSAGCIVGDVTNEPSKPDGRPLSLDPEAASADPNLPAFLARPADAPVYHGFPLLEDVEVEGFTLGKISDFEAQEMADGDAYIIAPDGTRAGLVWQIGDTPRVEMITAPDDSRWGVWAVWFTHPMRTRDDARRNLAELVPMLRHHWAASK